MPVREFQFWNWAHEVRCMCIPKHRCSMPPERPLTFKHVVGRSPLLPREQKRDSVFPRGGSVCSQNVADFELAEHLVGRQAIRICLHHAPRTLRPSIGSLCVRGFGLDSPVEGATNLKTTRSAAYHAHASSGTECLKCLPPPSPHHFFLLWGLKTGSCYFY